VAKLIQPQQAMKQQMKKKREKWCMFSPLGVTVPIGIPKVKPEDSRQNPFITMS
jgi:hypothetical protein